MKIILSEKYGRLASWMRKLPAQGVCGEVLRDDRNTLWCERVAGEEFVVKRFAVPLRLNRWVYTFFRPTKARRSYDYSLRLRRSGIAVADPVGYIECRRGLLFHTGYYVSKRLPYPTLQQLDREPQARQFEILDAFAAFTVRLPEKGVLDYDYNPGNIFYYREDGAWNFALIDVNRMAFRRNLSRRDCVEMLHHLDWETPYLDYVLIRYAELRRWDWKLLSGAVLLKQGINLPVRIRRFFKRLIGRK